METAPPPTRPADRPTSHAAIRLTEFARCAGCASKMGPGDLARALAPLPAAHDARLLVGRETFDDAAVFQLRDDLALVQTVDFFAPIVDDPYWFGRVAATNALSDVYAMGGEPLTALNIVAFPTDRLTLDVLTAILEGGQDAVHDASAVIVGGHTVVDPELKYGLSVTGRVHPARILSNAAARPGDQLVLTKPLGNGLVATALKQRALRDTPPEAAEREMLRYMTQLNREAAHAALAAGARCATDVTGFGLLGHALHIARASEVTLQVTASALPVLGAAAEAFSRGAHTGGEARNLAHVTPDVDWGRATAFERTLLTDPQTSGGLLVAVPRAEAAAYVSRVEGATVVGEVRPHGAHAIVVE